MRSVPGDLVEFEAVDYPHWRGTPKFKKLLFLLIPEESTRVSMVRTGEASIASISPEAIGESAGRRTVKRLHPKKPASGQVPVQALGEVELLGELALTGELKPVDGVLPAALAAAREGRPLVVPTGNGAEAALASGGRAYVARTLLEVCAHLRGEVTLPLASIDDLALATPRYPDLADVRGQAAARRALEVAAAGAHALLFIGPPGCGKTLLASRLPGLLPDPDETEALETAAIHSVSGQGLDLSRWRQRPYRSPHHLASAVALIGGGGNPRPGEVSLAHNGVLFLDELAEWSRQALETLRQPMESGRVIVSRAARQSEFPASFQLIAAMNPCPCGWAGDPSGRCGCSAESVARYRAKLSGPLLDRIDLQLAVPRLPPSQLRPDQPPGESTAVVRARVLAARARQSERAGVPTARLDQARTDRDCALRPRDRRLLERAIDQLQLSARALHRIQRVARTLADLAGEDAIRTEHVAEAIGYRLLDRAGPPA